jgi:hypothetical protein
MFINDRIKLFRNQVNKIKILYYLFHENLAQMLIILFPNIHLHINSNSFINSRAYINEQTLNKKRKNT